MKSKIKKNLAYQTIYQLLNTALPLITSPYLARVLGASQQGIFSYTQSIVDYFTLFAMLGVTNYGVRTIAACGDNRRERNINFWNIYIFQFVLSIIAMIVYDGVYLYHFCDKNRLIAFIQGFYILGALIDINWLFFGVEQFEITIKRSIFIRLLSFLGILLLVKQPADLWIYTFIMAGSTVFSNAIMWKFLHRIVDFSAFKYINMNSVCKHIKPNLMLFIPLMAMSVYHTMDKTMLGLLSTYEQTGFYYNSDKVINIPIGIINGIGVVMLPRMSSLAEIGDREQSIKIFNMSIELITCVSSAMAFGIAAISKEFIPVFFGDGFDTCAMLIIVLAPVLIIKSLSQTSRMQYLIPNHLEKIFIQSVFAGAISNFIANFFLIEKYGAMGAVIGTLIAEFVTCVWQYEQMSKFIAVKKTIVKSVIYIFIGFLMFLIVRMLAYIIPDGFIGIIIEITVGSIIYIVFVLITWFVTKNTLLTLVKCNLKKGA